MKTTTTQIVEGNNNKKARNDNNSNNSKSDSSKYKYTAVLCALTLWHANVWRAFDAVVRESMRASLSCLRSLLLICLLLLLLLLVVVSAGAAVAAAAATTTATSAASFPFLLRCIRSASPSTPPSVEIRTLTEIVALVINFSSQKAKQIFKQAQFFYAFVFISFFFFRVPHCVYSSCLSDKH